MKQLTSVYKSAIREIGREGIAEAGREHVNLEYHVWETWQSCLFDHIPNLRDWEEKQDGMTVFRPK